MGRNSDCHQLTRRALIGAGALLVGGLAAAPLSAFAAERKVKPALLARAMHAFQAHGARLGVRDRIAIADFSAPSREARFHIVDMLSGATTSLLVAHGRGSDPRHSGWLQQFSNEPGSAASSAGAYLTGAEYVGKHGRSRRLIGLDPQNSNAEPRAIVIHSAWYVGAEMIRGHGKLGRSEGCFAVSEADLAMTLEQLGAGRLIYADKV